jgi:hypothetical protein
MIGMLTCFTCLYRHYFICCWYIMVFISTLASCQPPWPLSNQLQFGSLPPYPKHFSAREVPEIRAEQNDRMTGMRTRRFQTSMELKETGWCKRTISVSLANISLQVCSHKKKPRFSDVFCQNRSTSWCRKHAKSSTLLKCLLVGSPVFFRAKTAEGRN